MSLKCWNSLICWLFGHQKFIHSDKQGATWFGKKNELHHGGCCCKACKRIARKP